MEQDNVVGQGVARIDGALGRGSVLAEDRLVRELRAAGCVFAEDEARLLLAQASTPQELDAMVKQRAAGLPLEQVLGWAEFCGLRIAIEPGVFVPRRRTEFLVRQAVSLCPSGAVLVDLCCGSGAISAAIAFARAKLEVHAADIDAAAVRCARRNLAPVGGHVYQGDLFEPLPRKLIGRVDLLVANAPYVPTDQIALMPPEARLYEPRVALDGGEDGLRILRRVTAMASRWLAPHGHLLVESSQSQAPELVRSAHRQGFQARVESCEELGSTVVLACRGSIGKHRHR